MSGAPPSVEPVKRATAAGGGSLASATMFALAVVVAIVAWRYFQLPGGIAAAEAGSMPSGVATDQIAGFRADTWYLPDEELLGFVHIPAGTFPMGSDPAVDPLAYENEFSARGGHRSVELPAFYIGRYEVTVAQFRAFVDATGHRVARETLEAPPTHPVAHVSWPDALAYARWLEATLKSWAGTPPELAVVLDDGWRLTLPTEAEWEKAARGTDGRIYPWGNEPRRDRANFGGSAPAPVGSFDCPECAFGLADMAGNVWEWTRSPYTAHPFDPATDSLDLEADALWVMRGGSFGDNERNVRTALRGGADPGVRRPFIGFRLVLSPG